MPKKKMIGLTELQKKPGHFAGKFWIWGDGKKTHINFIRMAMRTYRRLPPGFYEACEKSKSVGLKKMGDIAKKYKLKELVK